MRVLIIPVKKIYCYHENLRDTLKPMNEFFEYILTLIIIIIIIIKKTTFLYLFLSKKKTFYIHLKINVSDLHID